MLSLLSGCANRDQTAKLLNAAEQWDAEVQYKLGLAYSIGTVLPDGSKDRGVSVLDINGDTYDLSCIYVAKDFEEAAKWWRKSAELGHTKAMCMLGMYYIRPVGETHTDVGGPPLDIAEGIEWLRKAAEQGSVAAQCELGRIYFGGKYIPRDYAEAVKWLLKAKEQGSEEATYLLRALEEEEEQKKAEN
jgi:TPR repeat protein